MQEKFKQYLENEFRKIAPTKASAEYRKKLYYQLVDYAQELKLKGIDNEEVAYDLAIKSLGDMDQNLKDFEKQRVSSNRVKSKLSASAIASSVIMIATIAIYLIASLFAKPSIWSWSWLIILAGVIIEITAESVIIINKANPKAKAGMIRGAIYTLVPVATVFIALLLLMLPRIAGIDEIYRWWIAFILIPGLLAVAEIILSIIFKNKMQWLVISVNVIVICVILYIALGLLLPGFWHPGWLLILAGVAIAAAINIIAIKKAKNKITALKGDKNEENEKYYTEW